jgi:hypothetical protein
MNTDELRAKAQALIDAGKQATDAPWGEAIYDVAHVESRMGVFVAVGPEHHVGGYNSKEQNQREDGLVNADARFIALARNTVEDVAQALLDALAVVEAAKEVREADKELKAIEVEDLAASTALDAAYGPTSGGDDDPSPPDDCPLWQAYVGARHKLTLSIERNGKSVEALTAALNKLEGK